jgi:hypothetical protein
MREGLPCLCKHVVLHSASRGRISAFPGRVGLDACKGAVTCSRLLVAEGVVSQLVAPKAMMSRASASGDVSESLGNDLHFTCVTREQGK